MDTAWYTVQSKPHNETRVVRHLAGRDVPTFLPFLEVVQRRTGTCRTSLEPLFPGYLFVRLGPVDHQPETWSTVRWSPGVRSILGAAGQPVPVPEDAIEAIRDRMGTLGFVRPGRRFEPGDRVRFRTGPMVGLEAILDRQASKAGRVHVLLSLLTGGVRIETDELDLESA
ncbi:MAG TPA: transcription termination/antitermination NusG family protein [bacterium]|nr:transcription termination/antitermination NusG family protein [bacterium]